jgi:hypothetical protein
VSLGRVWIWRTTADGGVWLGWAPQGVIIILVLTAIAPLLWLHGAVALPALLLALASWERVRVDARGVVVVRGVGPLPLHRRRFPPSGQFVVHEDFDGPTRNVGYRVDNREPVVASSFDPDRVRALLHNASAGAWARDQK